MRREATSRTAALAENSQETARRRGQGRPFAKGICPNPGGRPKGSKTYAVRELWAEALDDPQRGRIIIEKLRGAVTSQKTVVQALESAARIVTLLSVGA